MINSVQEKEEDMSRQEQLERPQSTERELDGLANSAEPVRGAGVGDVAGRIGNVRAERITLDDGTVLSLPWFFTAATSELLTVGRMLKVKYENRDAEKLVAFVKVEQGSGAGGRK